MTHVAEHDSLRLFLCGDLMTGRGIDQILPHPSDPRLYEPYVRDARQYVELAEEVSGSIPRAVEPAYIWGDALAVLQQRQPDLRIVNLETSVTCSDEPWLGKGIHYRMHPRNIGCLTAAGIDCCVLANNHVMDWGRAGLEETLDSLHAAGIHTAGAGRNRAQAAAPAILEVAGKGRLIVFSLGLDSSGIPWDWEADAGRSGVNLLPDLSDDSVARLGRQVGALKVPGDTVMLSIHWGGNWGYDIPYEHRRFARRVIDTAGVDLVHGHSSHHPLGIEVHHGRPILYGCGDLFNDYEGIGGYEEYRGELSLMYLPDIDPADGRLLGLEMVPLRIRGFRLQQAEPADVAWLAGTLQREGGALGTTVEIGDTGNLLLHW